MGYSKARVLFYGLLSQHNLKKGGAVLIQPALAIGSGRIILENGVKIGYWPSPHFLSTVCHIEARGQSSIIRIGRQTQINNGFVAIAENCTIKIGENCFIGTRCEIYDSDFHSLSVEDRISGSRHSCQDVLIGDNVFIGSNARILKGVTIGPGSVIANSAVVTKDIPMNCVAAGVPARVIRQL
jgi:maltose O-acetyltransferase